MTRAAHILAAASMLLVAIVGVAKLWDLVAFGVSLRGAGVLPPTMIPWVIVVVPVLEFTLGLSWLLGLCRRAGTVATILMLTLFTAYLGVMIAEGSARGCGCPGRLATNAHWLDRPWVALLRNALMIGALGTYLVSGDVRRGRAAIASLAAPRADPTPSRAFTLIELILVIAMVALLVALVAPHLRTARDGARMAATQSLLGQHAQIMKTYTHDYRGCFPYMVDPKVSITILRSEIASAYVACLYFDASTRWHVALADAYYNGQLGASMFIEPMRGLTVNGPVLSTGFIYPCVFLAVPEYWNPSTRTSGIGQLGAVRDTQTVYPADKVLLSTDSHSWAGGPLRLMDTAAAFVDGHAEFRKADELIDGYAERFNPTRWGSHTTGSAMASTPLTHTLLGIRGRDTR